jgi:hypothetical protein
MLDTIRPLDIATMTGADANRLWDNVRKQTICFDDISKDRGDIFAARLASPNTAAFEFNDAGLVMVESIVPRLMGVVHWYLWDPKKVTETELVEFGREICAHVMDVYQLHRLCAAPPMFNKLALRVAQRVGFKYEGTMRQAFLYQGLYHDVQMWGLLRQDQR